jgi:hypothetical protein
MRPGVSRQRADRRAYNQWLSRVADGLSRRCWVPTSSGAPGTARPSAAVAYLSKRGRAEPEKARIARRNTCREAFSAIVVSATEQIVANRRAAHGRSRRQRAKRDEIRSALRGPQWTRPQLNLTLWSRTLKEHHEFDKPVTTPPHAQRSRNCATRPSSLHRCSISVARGTSSKVEGAGGCLRAP